MNGDSSSDSSEDERVILSQKRKKSGPSLDNEENDLANQLSQNIQSALPSRSQAQSQSQAPEDLDVVEENDEEVRAGDPHENEKSGEDAEDDEEDGNSMGQTPVTESLLDSNGVSSSIDFIKLSFI